MQPHASPTAREVHKPNSLTSELLPIVSRLFIKVACCLDRLLEGLGVVACRCQSSHLVSHSHAWRSSIVYRMSDCPHALPLHLQEMKRHVRGNALNPEIHA